MNPIPDEVSSTVRRAATAPAVYGGTLDDVRRRWRNRRRRHAVVTAGSVACLVALTSAGVPLLSDGVRSAGTSVTTADRAPSPPAQRLLVTGPSFWDTSAFWQLLPVTGSTIGEIGLDGSVTAHRIPKGWAHTAGLPDGRIVGLRSFDPSVGSGGPAVGLVVLHPDGSEFTRMVRAPGQRVWLVGATTNQAYLLREGQGVVRHDLASGRERLILPTGVGGVELGVSNTRLSLAADTLAVAAPVADTGCRIRILDLAKAGLRATFSIPARGCGPIQLSPDGRLVAVPYLALRPDTGADWRVAIADTGTGTGQVRADEVLAALPAPGPAALPARPRVQGIAWVDDRTVRIAWGGAERAPGAAQTKTASVTVQ